MAKLIVLALAFTALLAFASAHKTIVTTTTIQDENPIGRQQQCSHIEDQSFNQCGRYFQSKAETSPFEKRGQKEQGQGQGLRQMCCQELQNVDEQCQCEAVKKVLRDAMMTQQQKQQGGSFSGQMVERLKQKAERIISKCNLQIERQQCQVGTITTTTMITEENPAFPPQYGGSQQCRQMIPQRFNQCERFIEQALQSGFPRILMSINKHGQQQQQEQQIQKFQQQCCNELENVQQECHCEALQKVYEQAMQQQGQQQGQQHQGSRRGGQMQQVQQVVQALKNQCNLQAQQCRIPSAMF